jgi:hypothetical protein
MKRRLCKNPRAKARLMSLCLHVLTQVQAWIHVVKVDQMGQVTRWGVKMWFCFLKNYKKIKHKPLEVIYSIKEYLAH